jgi:hypothetical protein
MNLGQRTIELSDMLDDGLDEIAHGPIILDGTSTELGVPELDGMNVFDLLLGVDNEDTTTRVAFVLPGKKSGGQFPLAGTA